MTIQAVVCYLRKNGKILLQRKKKGLYGGGWWNAPGGKLNDNETPEEAAKREVFEETGLMIKNLFRRGKLNFYFTNKTKPDWIVYVFLTDSFSGMPKGNKEGQLKWTNIKQIPYNKMWPDDRYWLPLLLKNKKFKGDFWFDKKEKRLLGYEIKITKNIPR